MIPDTYEELVTLLTDRTEEDRVNWKKGSSQTYLVYFDDFSFAIRRTEDNWDDPEIHATLYDPNGSQIDGFQVYPNSGPDFRRMSDLYDAARRKALRIDEALHRIVSKLVTEETVGDDPRPHPNDLTEPDDDLPF